MACSTMLLLTFLICSAFSFVLVLAVAFMCWPTKDKEQLEDLQKRFRDGPEK